MVTGVISGLAGFDTKGKHTAVVYHCRKLVAKTFAE